MSAPKPLVPRAGTKLNTMEISLLVPSHLASTQKKISIVTFPDAVLSSFSLVSELISAMDV